VVKNAVFARFFMTPPTPQRIVRTLKDGYWDHTEVIEMADGSLRVRKRNRADIAPSPWGLESLRREILYLADVADQPDALFPPLLDHWDFISEDQTHVIGYDHPFYSEHRDAGQLARETALEQSEIDQFQDQLADALLNHVHRPATALSPLSTHLHEAVTEAFDSLEKIPEIHQLLHAPKIRLNGAPALGPIATWQRISHDVSLLTQADRAPQVRLHGDFFLENILWASKPAGGPPLVLIDPVSVAGVSVGPPVFDLVKYVSYASGELLALRSEWLVVEGFGRASIASGLPDYSYRIQSENPGLLPLQTRNWHARLQAAFIAHHGPINRRLYHLIDGYFSAAMAANTTGLQQKARLLKATADFNAALAS
jgi:hypothetical protein